MLPLSWSRVFPATHHSPFKITVLIVPCHTHGLNWLNLRPWALGGQSIRAYCRFPFIEKTDGNWGVLDDHSILIHLYPYILEDDHSKKKHQRTRFPFEAWVIWTTSWMISNATTASIRPCAAHPPSCPRRLSRCRCRPRRKRRKLCRSPWRRWCKRHHGGRHSDW